MVPKKWRHRLPWSWSTASFQEAAATVLLPFLREEEDKQNEERDKP
jgi:hypothetical protein